MKRTVTIEFETLRITGTGVRKELKWCDGCGAKTEFISRKQAFDLINFIRTQEAAFNPANIHFQQSGNGQAMLCLNSILLGNISGI